MYARVRLCGLPGDVGPHGTGEFEKRKALLASKDGGGMVVSSTASTGAVLCLA